MRPESNRIEYKRELTDKFERSVVAFLNYPGGGEILVGVNGDGSVAGVRDVNHADKIIDTYRFRKEEARYARRVDMKEIEKHDFNLNISRYVSTAKAEEEIDLEAVHGELVLLDQKIRTATERHNAFLKELGLPLLP
jgi:hypothetical protein